jgi:hypothetical protein
MKNNYEGFDTLHHRRCFCYLRPSLYYLLHDKGARIDRKNPQHQLLPRLSRESVVVSREGVEQLALLEAALDERKAKGEATGYIAGTLPHKAGKGTAKPMASAAGGNSPHLLSSSLIESLASPSRSSSSS